MNSGMKGLRDKPEQPLRLVKPLHVTFKHNRFRCTELSSNFHVVWDYKFTITSPASSLFFL